MPLIRGVVNARREGTVRLRIRGPAGAEVEVAAIVDSGFTASLSLPAATVAALSLARQSRGRAILADGSVREFDVYTAEVDFGGWRPVAVSVVGREPLIGMGLLSGHQLRIDVVPGGVVEVAPLPATP